MKFRPVVADLFHADGRMDEQKDVTKLIVAFCNFANVHKQFWFFLQYTYCVQNTLCGQNAGVFSVRRHCATSRKVAGSIPDGVIGFFH